MAKIITFNGRQVIEPGAYAQVRGAVEKPIEGASFGNLLFVDTGTVGSAFSYGAGINGELENGQDAIYAFDDIETFQEAIGGGVVWDLAKWLFKPSRDSRVRGVSRIYYVRAATTTAATAAYTFTGGGANGGVVTFKTKVEGTGANGAATGLNSSVGVGFGVKMEAGTLDTTKFTLKFYRGSYKGVDATVSPSVTIDGKAVGETEPDLIVQTAEFSTVQELLAWCNGSALFEKWFTISATVAGTGVVDDDDLTANAALLLFSGATQSFDGDDVDEVIANITELDYTFLMTDIYYDQGGGVTGTTMTKFWSHINSEAEFEKFLIAPAGRDADSFNDPNDVASIEHSIQVAGYYNSARVHVIHGDIKRPNFDNQVLRTYSVLYHAAMVCGRMAGVAPQIPVTWLDIDVTSVVHNMKKSERELAIQRGVMHLRYVQERGGWVIGKDINSKQDNSQDIYQDGTSPHGSIMRISSLLNKQLVQNIRALFIAGQNANTSSPEDIKSYIETYLESITAQSTADNLILNYQNVQVLLTGADYNISYSFTPNGPIDRVFITGFMLPISLGA